MLDSKFLTTVLTSLKGHQEAVLVFGMAVLGVGILVAMNNPLAAVGIPGVFYTLYLVRMWLHDRHTARLAELDLRRIEVEKDKRLARRRYSGEAEAERSER